MRSTATTIKAYLDELTPDRRKSLMELRRVIKAAVPELREAMQDNVPAYTLDGQVVCGIAAQKNFLGLYVCPIDVQERYAAEFAHLNCGKSCIRFKSFDDLPLDAVRAVIRDSASQVKAGT